MSFQEKPGASFAKQANRLVSRVGYSSQNALKYSAILFLKSVRARTRKAPETRKLSAVRGGFAYKVYKGGKEFPRFLPANSRDSAKRSRAVRVRYSGLAKTSWGWAMQDLFGSASGDKGRFKRPKTAIETAKTPTSVTIKNRLRYALEALKNGNASLKEAYDAASKSMRYKIEKGLARASGRKSA